MEVGAWPSEKEYSGNAAVGRARMAPVAPKEDAGSKKDCRSVTCVELEGITPSKESPRETNTVFHSYVECKKENK